VPLNVLYDHQIFQAQRFGGISRYFYELISRTLETPGLDVSLFMGLHINEYGLERHGDRARRFFGFKRPEIRRTHRIFDLANRALLLPFARSARSGIYHPTYYADVALPGFSGARVLTVHDMIHELHSSHFSASDPTSRRKRQAVAKADRIIAVSHSTKNDLVKVFGTDPAKIEVIHLANSLQLVPRAQPVREKPYFLFVAGRSGYKNFDTLLCALVKARELRADFELVCFGGGRFSAAEHQRISELKLAGRVHQCSGPDQLLADLYRHATALVYPSLYEGFGLPPLEAMHYGCPVICGNTSSIPEVVGDAGVYFDVHDSDSAGRLARKLEEVASHSTERARLTTLGREQVRKFSWEACARSTVSLYQRL
jgi:glycosyltransferase involved in cell wall biosynthesis